ncbi:MAG: intermembrane transport protein PqiB [Methylomarinum sp.]|nr:intermembrane transport protein PqiB [Methylomarinum sp.]
MTEQKQQSQADVIALKSISKIWLIPVVAAFIGLWMIYSHLSSEGPLITISFQTGEGIEAGKTKIRTKSVDIGLVERLELHDDLESVLVTARIAKKNQNLLKKDSSFWVVKPRIGKGGISGMGTLLSGAYIELAPGAAKDISKNFSGLEREPVTPAGTAGLHVTLDSNGDLALQVGDPILFRGIEVGRIDFVHFNAEERTVYYNAFIESPYNKLITTNTKFWAVNGVELDLSADGVRLQTGTLESIITGGVTFDVPKNIPRGEIVTKREYFTIYPNKDAIQENRYKQALRYILLFKDSIRGLKPNAPVEYKGIKIGSVIRTDVNYTEITNILDQTTLIPVLIKIEPARLGFSFADDESVLPVVDKEIIKSLKKGLRGSLVSGNLLTGSKYVELQYDEKGINELSYFSGHLVIPTREGQFDQILKQLSKVMDKVNKLPLEPVLISADKVLHQATATVKEFKKTASHLEKILKQTSDQNLPAGIQGTLSSFNKLAASFSEGSLTHTELQNLLGNMKTTLAELEPLLMELNQKPNSLIFSQQKNKDIEPQGVKK